MIILEIVWSNTELLGLALVGAIGLIFAVIEVVKGTFKYFKSKQFINGCSKCDKVKTKYQQYA